MTHREVLAAIQMWRVTAGAAVERMAKPTDCEELLTASQAGEALSASSQTIRNWIRGGRLHAVRIGNRS